MVFQSTDAFLLNCIMDSRFLVLLFLLLGKPTISQERTKRVINGQTFKGRPEAYEAIRYYGLIGTVHSVPWYTFGFWHALKETHVYGRVLCSGTLLTPLLLHTACHCVADYNSPVKRNYLRPPVLRNHWETYSVVYAGVNNRFGDESAASYSHIHTLGYAVHSLCAALGDVGAHTYDFALVRLDGSFMDSDKRTLYPWKEIGFAPQYTFQQIQDFNRYAMQKLLTCLYIGFGDFKDDSGIKSEVLRHGWGSLVENIICMVMTTSLTGIPLDKAREWMTWECTEKFPHNNYIGGPGDSGSPISCDNKYFGVHSGVQPFRQGKIEKGFSKNDPLTYDPYASAIEYRHDLLVQLYTTEKPRPIERSVDSNVVLSSQAPINHPSLAFYSMVFIIHTALCSSS